MGERVRARNLLSSYYGVAEEPSVSAAAPEEDDMNIDSSAFAVDKYVGTLLQYKSLEELVQRGNAMVSEIKSLDSDMQMLVYDNYNKFISATDTIRKMKNRVEERIHCRVGTHSCPSAQLLPAAPRPRCRLVLTSRATLMLPLSPFSFCYACAGDGDADG